MTAPNAETVTTVPKKRGRPPKAVDPNVPAPEKKEKPVGITEEELTFLSGMGPAFAERVKEVRKMGEDIARMKEALFVAKKLQRKTFRKIQKVAISLVTD